MVIFSRLTRLNFGPFTKRCRLLMSHYVIQRWKLLLCLSFSSSRFPNHRRIRLNNVKIHNRYFIWRKYQSTDIFCQWQQETSVPAPSKIKKERRKDGAAACLGWVSCWGLRCLQGAGFGIWSWDVISRCELSFSFTLLYWLHHHVYFWPDCLPICIAHQNVSLFVYCCHILSWNRFLNVNDKKSECAAPGLPHIACWNREGRPRPLAGYYYERTFGILDLFFRNTLSPIGAFVCVRLLTHARFFCCCITSFSFLEEDESTISRLGIQWAREGHNGQRESYVIRAVLSCPVLHGFFLGSLWDS